MCKPTPLCTSVVAGEEDKSCGGMGVMKLKAACPVHKMTAFELVFFSFFVMIIIIRYISEKQKPSNGTPVAAMIYVQVWKEKSRIYGFLVWPNLHYMLQSPGNAVSLEWEEKRAWKSSLSLVTFFLFLFLFLSLTNQLYHILSLSFFPLLLQADEHTRQCPCIHTLGARSEGLNTSNLTHAGALCTQTHAHTEGESFSAPQRHLRFPRTNFLTLFHSLCLLSLSLAALHRTSALDRLHI